MVLMAGSGTPVMPMHYTAMLLISGLLFLGTAGYIAIHAEAVADLFGKRRRDAEPGELIADPHTPHRGASSPRLMKAVIAVHVLGLLGLILGGLAAAELLLRNHPEADPLPPEMNPIAQLPPSR